MPRSICRSLIPFGAVICFSSLLSAGVVTYTSSAAFQAATTVNLVENYGTLTNGQLISSGSTVDQLTYSAFVLTGGATQLDITNEFNSFSGLSLGAAHGGFTFFFGGERATITFPSAVNAIGIFFNVNLNSGNYGFTDSNSDSVSAPSTSYDTNTFVFAGLTSTTPFTSVSFFSTDASLGSFNIPEVEAPTLQSSTVPEPASAPLLLAAGFALLVWQACLRRRPVRG